MNDDIAIAQVKAPEDVVVERLRREGLPEPSHILTVDYAHVEPSVIVRCGSCGQLDCQVATSAAERLRILIAQRQQLEHSLATAFTTMQRERVPGKRQELWAECLRLANQLEKLND